MVVVLQDAAGCLSQGPALVSHTGNESCSSCFCAPAVYLPMSRWPWLQLGPLEAEVALDTYHGLGIDSLAAYAPCMEIML